MLIPLTILGLPAPASTSVGALPNPYQNAGLLENKPTIFGDTILNTPTIKTAPRGGYQIVEFTNPSGIVLEFGAIQTQKTINISIESALNSKNSGKAIEGKVADFIQKETNEEVIRFGTKVNRLTGAGKAGEIDIETKNQIIEVKKSASVIDKSQIDKLTQINRKDFFNYEKKEVIIYIDEPIDMNNPYIRRDIEYARENGIKIINSLEELKKEIK